LTVLKLLKFNLFIVCRSGGPKLVHGVRGSATSKSGLAFSLVLLLNHTHDKPEV